MVGAALAAYIHYFGFMCVFAALAVEWALCKPQLSAAAIQRLVRADIVYAAAAAAVVVSGVLRVLYFGKGAGFYLANPIFHLKVAIFVGVGIASVYPTRTFLRWRKTPQQQPAPAQIRSVSQVIAAELAAVAALPLLAALMARGFAL